ncbi:MAG: polysaccharide biosynthesis tyrosine autokinase [Rhodothermales bacterium]|nr:polysaccharide biosynthesis tyrosine autokinase [Rhodothermales bacterium]
MADHPIPSKAPGRRPVGPRATPLPVADAPAPVRRAAPAPALAPAQAADGTQGELLLNLLYRGRWFLFVSFVLTLTGTGLYTYFQVPVYRADSLVLVDNRLAPDLKDALDPSADRNRSGRSVETEIYVLQRSMDVATRVADRLVALQNDPVTGRPITLLAQASSPAMLAYAIQNLVTIQREPVADVLRISAISTDAHEASLLANFYAEELVDRALWRSRSRLSATRAFLENEATERNRELRALEEQMKVFLRQNGGLTMSVEATALIDQVTALETARTQNDLELKLKQVSARLLEDDLAGLQPRLAERLAANTTADIERTRTQMADIDTRLDQIYRQNPALKGTPEASTNPTIAALERDRAGLQTTLARLTDAYVAEANTPAEGDGLASLGQLQRQLNDEQQEIARLEARSQLYSRQLDAYQATLNGLPGQQIALTQLQRSLQTTERAYLFLREKLEDVRIAEESEQGYAEVIRQAVAPFKPEYPDTSRNLILGGLVGLLVGLGLAILYQQRTRGILFAPEDLQNPTCPLLGIIPAMPAAAPAPAGNQALQRTGELDPHLIVGLSPASMIVDAYRKLRFNILNAPGPVRTLVVTSPNPGEGKSLTALNLGIALAQTGRRTIVVDTDLRRPTVHSKLGLTNQPGFIEMLEARHLQFRRALREQDNLYVLTAGGSHEHAAEILGSPDMPAFISELKRYFDIILFDTPPFMAVSDAVFLASLCDATLLVAAAGKTRDYEIQQGVREFEQAGQRVLGTVLNAFDPTALVSSRFRYRYYRDAAYYAEAG